MESLNEHGFEALDLFSEVESAENSNLVRSGETTTELGEYDENIPSEELPKEKLKRGRGRPPKNKKESIKLTTKSIKSVDDLPPEVIDVIFNSFSTKALKTLAEELNLRPKYIQRVVEKLENLFLMAITTGDLTQENFDKYIKPKLVEYVEPVHCNGFESFVHTEVEKIKKC